MDFTPGGFNNVSQEDFEPVGGDAPNPTVMGTRCRQLAMTVIYESAFTVICDSPDNYRDQPGADFLKLIQTTWDETRYLDGYPGEGYHPGQEKGCFLVCGGNDQRGGQGGRIFCSSFLEADAWQATIWKDGPEADSESHSADIRKQWRSKAGTASISHMARGGGFVMILEPLEELST